MTADLVANLLGRVVAMGCSVIFIPSYIRLLGVEGYALCGILPMLLGILTPLENGLSTTMNREIASRSGPEGQAVLPLFRTLFFIYFFISLAVLAALALVVPFLSESWFRAGALSQSSLRTSLFLIAGVVAVQFPLLLCTGGMQGMQKHVVLNVIQVGCTVIRMGGVVPILERFGGGPELFWQWNLAWYALQAILLGCLVIRFLPRSTEDRWFDIPGLKRVGRFAVGVSGIGMMGIILAQADKVVLSRLLPLEQFGWYTMAITAASGLNILVAPLFSVYFPRFSVLRAAGNQLGLVDAYHQGCQTLAALTLPTGLLGAWFAQPLLELWLHDPGLAQATAPTFAVYLAGTVVNSLFLLPYAMQLAHGISRISFLQNSLAVVVFLPTLVLLAMQWGTVGAAAAWLFINVAIIGLGIPYMHRFVLPGEARPYFANDILRPGLGALGGLILPWLVDGMAISLYSTAYRFPVYIGLGVLFSALMAPRVRPGLVGVLRGLGESRGDAGT